MNTTPKKFVLSKLSLGRLNGVDANLVKVVQRAIEITPQDFMVVEGVRSKEQCYINYGKGRTVAQCTAKGVPAKYAQPKLAKVTWLNNPLSSKHVSGKAVDLVPYPVNWNDLTKFDQVAKAMFAAAKELGVSIRWGADWDNDGNYREKGEYDSPHFEL
ncbi:M15 family metallopeptidase [Acinetobacter johnsonii]|uniref:M15 family metallopeptidase n=1 Tax=Acinetobacter johnsonii TaxID=40214 RepID=UPI003D185E08